MENGSGHSVRFAAFLYKLEKMQRLNTTIDPGFRPEKSLYGMLLIREADGEILVNGSRHSLQSHTVFMISPQSEVKLIVEPGRPADAYFLQFHVLQAGPRGHYVPANARFPQTLTAVPFPLIFCKLQALEQKHHSQNVWDVMEANIRFQEIIRLLLQETLREQPFDQKKAIYLARDYMEQNYRTHITREMLANIAGLNTDYFSRAFKRQFGKSPMEYLNDVRINEAKRLLVQSGEPIRSVAQNVGFSDEFYFSRKFKAQTGCSPGVYAKKFKHSFKIASLNHLITGHLLVLGHEPYAAMINNAFPVLGQRNHTINIGLARPDLEKLMKVKPDLIVRRGTRYAETRPEEKVLEQIAPTMTLSYSESWRAHFRTIAGIVGKDKEAEDWLARYESKAVAIGKRIKNRIGDETFLILGIGQDRYVVYGQRNIGAVLYGDLNLPAPDGVKHIGHFKEIELDELPALEADRILLTIFRNDGTMSSDQAIRKQLRRLYASKQWQSLRAVRNGKVYGIYDGRHLYTSYNPLSHHLLLDKLQQLLLAD